MKDKKENIVQVDILDVLLDADNTAPIYITDSNGKVLKFDQIAVIPHDDDLYCILKPITPIDGVGENEAIVFHVDTDSDGKAGLSIEEDEKKAYIIFQKYEKLLTEEDD